MLGCDARMLCAMNITHRVTYNRSCTIAGISVAESRALQRCRAVTITVFFSSQYTCGTEMNYTMHVGNESYHCVNDGEVVDIDAKSEYYRRTGSIVCAAYEDVCMPTTATVIRPTTASSNLQLQIIPRHHFAVGLQFLNRLRS